MVRLARAGRPLIVVSNQRGVSRGLVSCATLSTIESRIQEALAEHSCHVEAFKYCVHDLDTRCDCRKPRPGLLVSAAAEMGLDLRRSWMVGDTDEDMEAGSSAGCRTILLTTDMGRNRLTAESLSDAAAAILAAGPADVPDDHAYAR
jgi:D-glycero-D-manno-heptose 1,7-bisphosphate phosphatase